jgi:SAM-dependent methyltransferase
MPGNAASAPASDPLHAELASAYEESATAFYEYLPADVRDIFIGDARYHKARYLDCLALSFGHDVIELGSDKPFITHYLRTLHPQSRFHTISIDIPFSPYPIIRIDIETEAFPFDDGSISDVIFTEVLEHLFRDPAATVFQINRVLEIGGKLFLTTPNACGYDVLVNLLGQANPNGRNQFYEAIESGHPHLWTASECRILLEAHGFMIDELSTVDYYHMPKPESVGAFLAANSANPELNGQVLRIVAAKQRNIAQVTYPEEIFPQRRPVQLQGALLKWVQCVLKDHPN